MKAAKEGDVEVFKQNIKLTEKVESPLSWLTHKDKKSRTPLHLSSLHGHVHVVHFILKAIFESTKDVEIRTRFIDITDIHGKTPLFYAASRNHTEVVKYLVDKMASLDKCTNESDREPGSTALMVCAEKNNVSSFKLLLQRGANILKIRDDEADALYLAACYGRLEIIKILARANKLESIVNRKAFHGRTALLTASLHGHLQVCKELYANGADLNHQDDEEFTALIYASNEGHMHVTKWLVENGANIYLKDKYGGSALNTALANNHTEIVYFLIDSVNNSGKDTEENG